MNTAPHSSGSVQYSLFDEPPTLLVSGKSIRTARLERGLSVRALAKLAGVDAMTVLRVERGEQEGGSSTVAKISRALGLDEERVELAQVCIEPGSKEHLVELIPWAEDEWAQEIVRSFPDGLTNDRVAEFVDLSPSSIDAALASALEKLRAQATEDSKVGEDTRDWIENVLTRRAMREARSSSSDWMGKDCDDEY